MTTEETDTVANTASPNALGLLGSKVAFTNAVSPNMHGMLGSFVNVMSRYACCSFALCDPSNNTCKPFLEGRSIGSLHYSGNCRPRVLKT